MVVPASCPAKRLFVKYRLVPSTMSVVESPRVDVAVSTQLLPSHVSVFPNPAPVVSTSVRSEITVAPPPAPPPIHVPFIEKHPFAMLIPPVEENVEVDVVKLIPFVSPIERSATDDVVPTD